MKRSGFKTDYSTALAKRQAKDAERRENALQGKNETDLGLQRARIDRQRPGTVSLRRGGRLKAGKKTKEWDQVRAWLKVQFAKKGIQTCQLKFAGCWFDNALSFCHPAKRRNLAEGELYVAALGCTPCHDQLEVMPPTDMRRIVEGLFAETRIQIP